VDVPLFFEAGERTGRVSYDRDGKVAGLVDHGCAHPLEAAHHPGQAGPQRSRAVGVQAGGYRAAAAGRSPAVAVSSRAGRSSAAGAASGCA
jgi:hypothetical protein